jgi:hypothetical protein
LVSGFFNISCPLPPGGLFYSKPPLKLSNSMAFSPTNSESRPAAAGFEIHLPKAMLGRNETLSHKHVLDTVCRNVRNQIGIQFDVDGTGFALLSRIYLVSGNPEG